MDNEPLPDQNPEPVSPERLPSTLSRRLISSMLKGGLTKHIPHNQAKKFESNTNTDPAAVLESFLKLPWPDIQENIIEGLMVDQIDQFRKTGDKEAFALAYAALEIFSKVTISTQRHRKRGRGFRPKSSSPVIESSIDEYDQLSNNEKMKLFNIALQQALGKYIRVKTPESVASLFHYTQKSFPAIYKLFTGKQVKSDDKLVIEKLSGMARGTIGAEAAIIFYRLLTGDMSFDYAPENWDRVNGIDARSYEQGKTMQTKFHKHGGNQAYPIANNYLLDIDGHTGVKLRIVRFDGTKISVDSPIKRDGKYLINNKNSDHASEFQFRFLRVVPITNIRGEVTSYNLEQLAPVAGASDQWDFSPVTGLDFNKIMDEAFSLLRANSRSPLLNQTSAEILTDPFISAATIKRLIRKPTYKAWQNPFNTVYKDKILELVSTVMLVMKAYYHQPSFFNGEPKIMNHMEVNLVDTAKLVETQDMAQAQYESDPAKFAAEATRLIHALAGKSN